MSTTETALTAHLVMPDGHPGDDFMHEISHQLRLQHKIVHVTLQVETGKVGCPFAPHDVI
jgi:cobalt-zinc-cadmium efflux system protein